jgi:EAL domain-containing protein (putative c-di-GMP-specific phosphodiesterase class I)/GGDEF domain-containing protein
MIFTGNFLISVKNTKEYLELESTTKAQDTATGLGMTLKSFMDDKQDPEIVSIINAIANRGFYKEIRLEDVSFGFTAEDLINSSNLEGSDWEISEIKVDQKLGSIEPLGQEGDLGKQLALLENETIDPFNEKKKPLKYIFKPAKDFKDGSDINITFKASKDKKTVKSNASLNISKILVKVSRAEKFEYVPQWFIDLIPLKMSEMKSEITNGWNTTAVIYVSANAGDAYAKLYEQAKGAIIYAVVAFFISIVLLVIFLQFILQPLKNIEKLAISIAQGKFEIITKLPWTTEIRKVSIAMNDMSTKIEGVIRKLNKNLENMTKKLSQDELTSLQLRQTFETDMKKMFISKEEGFVFSIKIDDLGEFAKTHTNKEVDKFLIEFSKILSTLSNKITPYRFFGSEFAMIAKGIKLDELKSIVEKLKKDLGNLSIKIHKKEIAHIGVTPFNPIGTIPGIVASAHEAYEKAKLIGPNEVHIRDDNDLARDMEEWKSLVFDIIDNNKFQVSFIGQAYGLSKENQDTLLMEEAFTQARDNDGEAIPIGTFVSIAEKYSKILDFDKGVVSKVIDHINNSKITHSISINLSLDSVVNLSFRQWLKDKIEDNSDIASQLVFSVTAYGVAKDVEEFKNFIEDIHSVGAKIIIKRFETKFIPLDHIKDFNLDYIRLARDYTNGISKGSSKKGFVESMQELSTLLNIKLFAENVKEDDDYETVRSLNLYGASR